MGTDLIKVTTLSHLRQLAADSECPLDVVLVLKGGAKSSKHLFYSPLGNGRNWYLYEHDAGRYYTERQLAAQTLIVRAIQHGALYAQVQPSWRNVAPGEVRGKPYERPVVIKEKE